MSRKSVRGEQSKRAQNVKHHIFRHFIVTTAKGVPDSGTRKASLAYWHCLRTHFLKKLLRNKVGLKMCILNIVRVRLVLKPVEMFQAFQSHLFTKAIVAIIRTFPVY